MDHTQPTQKLRWLQEFLVRFHQILLHTADKENYIADALYSNYKWPSPASEEEDYVPQNFSHRDCEYDLWISHGKATGHHHYCPYQDDDDWE